MLSACNNKGSVKKENSKSDIEANYETDSSVDSAESDNKDGLSLGEQKRIILDRVEVKDQKAKKFKAKQTDDIFKELAGKEFSNYPASGSERIYFRENGNVDGAALYGNGNMFSSTLYKAKFDLVKKIDDLTYEIKLTSLDYQNPVDKEEKINKNGYEYIHNFVRSPYFDKKVGQTFKIYLPKTKVSSLKDRDIMSIEGTDNHIANGQINVFALAGKDKNSNNEDFVIMSELVDKKMKNAKKDDKNYLSYFEAGWKRFIDEVAKDKDENPEDKTNPDDENFDILAKMILDSYEMDTESGKDIINLDKAQKFLKENAGIFADMKYAEKYKDRFKDIGISGLDLKADKDQPIIKIRGSYVDEAEIEPENGKFGLWDNYLRARLNSGEDIIIKLKLLGNRLNYTYDASDGSKVVNVWALPLGVYKTTDDNGKEIRVFEFVSGKGVQDQAYKLFGDDYNK